MGFRISVEDEVAGIDTTAHAETGYDLGGLSAGVGAGAVPPPGRPLVGAGVEEEKS
jgi:Amt family ammonium transporter